MNDKVKQIIDRLLLSFQSGNVAEALSIAVLPSLNVPCSKWSLLNRILVFLADSSDARGYRQWQEVERHVKKGATAIYILSPRHKRTKDEETEEEKVILTGFSTVAVFRYEDTDGKPLEIPDLKPKEPPPLVEVAQSWGIQISWQSFSNRLYGFYSPGKKEIVLATHDESVFFHELAHAAHERVKGSLKPGQEWAQEVVAELTAAVLAHLCGKKTNDGASYRYIRSYAEKAGKDVHKACLSVITDVGKCLDMILQAREEKILLTA